MSYREKSAWAELVSVAAVWGWYFWVLATRALSGAITEQGFVGAMGATFVLAVVLSIVVAVASGILVEVMSRKSDRGARDEREAWAGLRATRIAHGVLIVLIFCLAVLGFGFGAFGGAGLAERTGTLLSLVLSNGLVLFANGAVAALVLAELAHYGALIVFLRRGR
ncbi:hypothetical protein [Brevundimonas lutea]|uniref:hypothetical protein n=1 Tax=Brevundimonas lutea TaxID=2293980 RepID=UPI000F042A18|nr:hypothetical protein [Brevundimonas lutea]